MLKTDQNAPAVVNTADKQRNGDELGNALSFLTSEVKSHRRKDSIDALTSTIGLYHRNTHGETTALLLSMVSACVALAEACVQCKRNHEAIKALDSGIVLQRVVDHRRRHATIRGRPNREGASPECTSPTRVKHAEFNMILRRAPLMFDGGHYLLATRDYLTIERALSRAAHHIRQSLLAAGKSCAANEMYHLSNVNTDLSEQVRLTMVEKTTSALQVEFAALRGRYQTAKNVLIENIGTCLRALGSFTEALEWLNQCDDPSDRVLGQKALCDLVRAASKPEDVTAAIAMVRSCATRETLAASLSMTQSIVQHFLSTYAVGLTITKGLDDDSAVREACEAILPALTNGTVRGLNAISEGLPTEVVQADKHVMHSVVTVMNFATSYDSMDVWNAVLGEMSGRSKQRARGPTTRLRGQSLAHGAYVPIESVDVARIPAFISDGGSSKLVDVDDLDATGLYFELQDMAAQLDALHVEGAPAPLNTSIHSTYSGASADAQLSSAENSAVKRPLKGPNTDHPGVSPTDIEADFADDKSNSGDDNDELDEPFTPVIHDTSSSFLTGSQRAALHAHLPASVQHLNWRLLYSTHQHGTSLNTLFNSCFDASPVLLLLQLKGSCIGAYITTPIRPSSRYTGLGETFVFSFRAGDCSEVECYHWSQQNDYFLLAKRDSITIGGGGKGPAIRLRESLNACCTDQCATFDSPPLCAMPDDGDDVDVFGVEVLTFEQCGLLDMLRHSRGYDIPVAAGASLFSPANE